MEDEHARDPTAVVFDEPEYRRWIETARAHLRAAGHNLGVADHAAVLLAEQAVQCALKALLHGVGSSRDARGHALVDLLRLVGDRAGLSLDDDLRDAVIGLARDYQATRYPDVLPGGTPAEYYSTRDADRAIGTARRALHAVEGQFTALLAAGRPTKGEAGGGCSEDGP